MTLSIDCVRNILLVCEDTEFLSDDLVWNPVGLLYFADRLPQYSKNQIAYTLVLLDEAGYLILSDLPADNCLDNLLISRLTYNGHELLDSIKPENVWNKVLKTIGNIGNVSLPVLQDIATQALASLLI